MAERSRSRVVDWWFRNRRTGAITIAQPPNPPLWVFIGATALRVALSPEGGAATALRVVSTVALAVWAVLEVVRGVNPFRRLLGGVVLAWQFAAAAG